MIKKSINRAAILAPWLALLVLVPAGVAAVSVAPLMLQSGNGVWVDAVHGSDSGGSSGSRSRPFATVSNAVQAASYGDTVFVLPGSYTNENGLLKPGVNIHFHAGSLIVYTNTATTNGAGFVNGMFDDRLIGPTTNWLTGNGRFIYQGGTLTNNSAGGFGSGNDTVLGCLVITNSGSRVLLEADSIQLDSHLYNQQTYAAYVGECTNVVVDVGEVIDIGGQRVQTGVDEFSSAVFGSSTSGGIYWESGDMTVRCNRMIVGVYGVYAAEVIDRASRLDYQIDYMENRGTEGTVYLLGDGGMSANWSTWGVCNEIIGTNASSAGGWSAYYQGKHYLRAGKVSNPNASASAVQILGNSSGGTLKAWVTVQKASAAGSGYSTSATGSDVPLGFIEIDHYESLAGGAKAMTFDGGKSWVKGGAGIMTNGTCIQFTSGNATVSGFHGYSVTNSPVIIAASGLQLRNCSLVNSNKANTVYAASALSALAYDCIGSQPPHANATVTGLTTNNAITFP